MLNKEFWKNKNVFLTGHTGFKGGWLSLLLKSLGANLTGYSLEPEDNKSFFKELKIEEDMSSVIGDIRDFDKLSSSIKLCNPEIIIHMAAQPLVGKSYEDPIETYSTNVMGTVNLFESVRKIDNLRAILNVTTDKCYKNQEWSWGYRENDMLGGHDPYSNSKACSELVTSSFRQSFFDPSNYSDHGVSIASARAGNVIGGGDFTKGRLIPDIMDVIYGNSSERLVLRNPSAVRPWQHVLEPLKGYLMLIEKQIDEGPSYSKPWNFGPLIEDSITVSSVIEIIERLTSKDLKIAQENSDIHETSILRLDISNVQSELNWKPSLSIDESIELALEWYKAFYIQDLDIIALTLGQINRYIK